MIHVSRVVKRYPGVTALDEVSLEVAQGEFFGLLGPNGAGKTTLMHLLVGYRDPDSGELAIAGKPVGTDGNAAKMSIGFVPQSLALYDDLSAMENLEVFGGLYLLPRRLLRERALALLESVQLTERRRDKVATFSGGMKRRLNLAAALLHDPHILLCDEPTVGVDPQSRNAIFEYLEKLNEEGKTIVYTTHYMEEVERLCTRLAILDLGRVIAEGTVTDILGRLPFDECISINKIPAMVELAPRLQEFGTLADEESRWEFRLAPGKSLSAFFAVLERNGIDQKQVELRRPTLEQVFLHLTGRRLRD